ncbi:dihydroxyacetone kinase phosphoryl donor subunit DhaM [Pantoea allii]|uniref:dihydroxyacetone kinase phosphoryl donor subunit DhaM n=1 Tax=Pantoea allii TaxID=574096 RepID=UPI001F4DCCE7|nr:dihydroxyacetone kinase phosphoryl donor subunit DhaM [Pantoea allii]MCH9297062.1 dihydroxyacetone kinase subunit DhaM [Pantoea allii]
MVNLVIVSHSAMLGEGVEMLARQMLTGDKCKLAVAAGIDDPDHPIGTDPLKVMAAIESVAADTDHVLVMMDMGSALLSAETALDLLDPAIAAKVRLCAAPLVEGTLAATVSAAAGADIDKVIEVAMHALEAKQAQLGIIPAVHTTTLTTTDRYPDARSVTVIIKNHHGLHVRPASRLVAALAGLNAELVLEKQGQCVKPDSINQIALLQVRCNDAVTLSASGPDAERALAAFASLAAENFGEHPESMLLKTSASAIEKVEGKAVFYPLPLAQPARYHCSDVGDEHRRLQQAIAATLSDLNALATLAEKKYGSSVAAIFSGHHTLLDDDDLFDAACEVIRNDQCCAESAWYQVLMELSEQYQQLDDAYLQARFIDIEDILYRSLCHLKGSDIRLPTPDIPAIIVADNIFPSAVVSLDARQVKGICLREGSALSHAAIIAQQAGIAFICQQDAVLDIIQPGDRLLIDANGPRVSYI